VHVDDDLTGARGRIVDLGQYQRLGRTELLAQDGSHGGDRTLVAASPGVRNSFERERRDGPDCALHG
jgi:hypothetical protein